MQVQPYLMFDGRCEEALAFYAQALGAQTQLLMRFRDSPEPPAGECSASAAVPGDKVMHAELRVGETTLMASDGLAGGSCRTTWWPPRAPPACACTAPTRRAWPTSARAPSRAFPPCSSKCRPWTARWAS